MDSIASYSSSGGESAQSSPAKSPGPGSSLTTAAGEKFAGEKDERLHSLAPIVAGAEAEPEDKSCHSDSLAASTKGEDASKSCAATVEAIDLPTSTASISSAQVTAANAPKTGAKTYTTRRRPRTDKGTCTTAGKRKYCIKYEGNGSKRWDGKKITVNSETLESLYDTKELVVGKDVVIPWPTTNGEVQNWKGVLVDPTGKYYCVKVHAYALSLHGTFCFKLGTPYV